ncbi:hypothetical protein MHU86_19067 [Fragilaria crotonensis]|nr:hypothetical protein MHU86_19067 [Fragilaria crotonensis]
MPETRDHILKCTAASRQNWRDSFHHIIDEFHAKEETNPLLRNLWNETIRDWMVTNEEVEFQASPIFFSTDVRALITQQNSIGWRQTINGRFSAEWSRIQDDHYARLRSQRGTQDRRSGHRWQTKLICLIWKEWQKLWKIRNEELHGSDAADRAMREKREISAQLREVYGKRLNMNRVRELLLREEHEHMHKPLWVTRNWLTVNVPIFKESAKRAKEKAIAGVRSIRSYFEPVR